MTNYDIIIVRGAPGAGKSTFLKLLRKSFAGGAAVEVDIIRGMINNVKWINKDEHIHALNATLALSREYLQAGYTPVIIADTLGKARMKQFISRLDRTTVNGRPVRYYTVSLFCTDDVLVKRITNRPDGFKDLGASKVINHEMGKPGFPPELLLDTSHLTPNEVLEVVSRELGLD